MLRSLERDIFLKLYTHYGQAEFGFGVPCDVYVLSNGQTVFSERGAADLFGMKHVSLRSVVANGLPKNLEPFVGKGWSMTVNSVKVTADNSPHKGREITVYDIIDFQKNIFH